MSSTGRARGHLNPVSKLLSGAAGVVGFGPAEAVGAVDVEPAEGAELAEAVAAVADNQTFRGHSDQPALGRLCIYRTIRLPFAVSLRHASHLESTHH